jgi:hypothetical protein
MTPTYASASDGPAKNATDTTMRTTLRMRRRFHKRLPNANAHSPEVEVHERLVVVDPPAGTREWAVPGSNRGPPVCKACRRPAGRAIGFRATARNPVVPRHVTARLAFGSIGSDSRRFGHRNRGSAHSEERSSSVIGAAPRQSGT